MKQTKELLIKQKASNKTIILKLQSNRKKNKKFEAITEREGGRERAEAYEQDQKPREQN